MTEEKLVTIEEELKNRDPRDFILSESFIKKAKSLDKSGLPWDRLRKSIGRVYGHTHEAEFICGIADTDNTADETESWLTIISQGNREDGQAEVQSTEIKNLNLKTAQIISELASLAILHLSEESCVKVLEQFIKFIQQNTSESEAFITSGGLMLILNAMPKSSNSEAQTDFSFLKDFKDGYGVSPSERQVKELRQFLEKLQEKAAADFYDRAVKSLVRSIYTTDYAFGDHPKYETPINYYLLFMKLFEEAINNDPQVARYEDRLSQEELEERFPVEKLVRKKVEKLEDIRKRLLAQKAEITPNFGNFKFHKLGAAMVRLDQVVGGGYEDGEDGSFLLQEGARGEEHIFKTAQEIQSGKRDIAGAEPIEVIKHQNKFYVGHDGRHRVSALKALGVPFAPMLVIEVFAPDLN